MFVQKVFGMRKGICDIDDRNVVHIGNMDLRITGKPPIKERWFVDAVRYLNQDAVQLLLDSYFKKNKISYSEWVDKNGFHYRWEYENESIVVSNKSGFLF